MKLQNYHSGKSNKEDNIHTNIENSDQKMVSHEDGDPEQRVKDVLRQIINEDNKRGSSVG
jgi:hypothetical protein